MRLPLLGPGATSGITSLYAETTPAADHRVAYEPSLDGLRGLAAMAVLLYHAGVPWAAGGYLGVDAFFVLSGYLITSLLLAEWHRTGSIRLGRFWAARVRRLVPALLLALTGVGLLCLVLDPAMLSAVRGDALATLGYVMNWRLVAQSTSYFAQFTTSPLQHAWSLAIEEQYYLVWPVVVLLFLRWRPSTRAFLAATLGLAAASAAWMVMIHSPGQDPSRLYFGTDTRAQSLLVGSALAAAVAAGWRVDAGVVRNRLVAAATAAAGLALLAWMWLPGTADVLYRGGFTLFAVAAALVVLACTHLGDNPVRRALRVEPLTRLGVISYGLYLYHFPIYLWLNSERTGLEPDAVTLLALRLAVTFGAATASYVLVERPIRAGSLDAWPLSTTARRLLAPAAAAAVLILVVLTTARATVPIADAAAQAGAPGAAAPPPAGAGELKALLVGDSVAYSVGVGLEGDVAAAQHLSVWNQAVLFCELLPHPRVEDGKAWPPSRTCENWPDLWRRDVASYAPDVSVLQVGAWEVFDREVNGTVVPFGTPASDTLVDGALDLAVGVLSSAGRPVVLVTTPPLRRNDGVSSREWTQNETRRTDHFNERLRAAAGRHPGTVRILDLAGFVCPRNQCPDEIDGVPVRADGLHFTGADAVLVGRWYAAELRRLASAS
jgi:peptidoglycan/LPS O-acetylase OafA/YrhL